MTRSIPDAESMTVEFKSDRGPLSDHDLLLAVVCLANTEGGDLCLGVEDDGRVTGLHSSHQNVSTLAAMFANRTSPPVGVRVAAFDANLPFLQMIVEEEGRTGTSLPVDALIALGELRDERRASSAQIARAIQRDDATAKRVAERLVEAGIVEAQGNTRARTYILSAKAYRALGSKAEYVRQAGFDALQQEQMVTKYAREHGSIRRQDVIELCRITDRQASRLLRKLVDSGHLTMAGTRKTAVYTPAHVGNPRKNKDMAGS